MALTIGLTWTFWSGGILGSNREGSGGVHIGSGQTVTTQIELGNFNFGTSDTNRLIPYYIFHNPINAAEIANATDEVYVVIPVTWEAVLPGNASIMDDAESTLTVAARNVIAGTSLTIDRPAFAQRDLTPGATSRYFGSTQLFDITFRWAATQAGALTGTQFTSSIAIEGNQTIYVAIIIRMNIPQNSLDYDDIHGSNLTFTFDFTVAQPT